MSTSLMFVFYFQDRRYDRTQAYKLAKRGLLKAPFLAGREYDNKHIQQSGQISN
jgi:hypothetical protein